MMSLIDLFSATHSKRSWVTSVSLCGMCPLLANWPWSFWRPRTWRRWMSVACQVSPVTESHCQLDPGTKVVPLCDSLGQCLLLPAVMTIHLCVFKHKVKSKWLLFALLNPVKPDVWNNSQKNLLFFFLMDLLIEPLEKNQKKKKFAYVFFVTCFIHQSYMTHILWYRRKFNSHSRRKEKHLQITVFYLNIF